MQDKDLELLKLQMNGMPYFYFSVEELVVFIEKDLGKLPMWLYAYMRLNCDNARAISRRVKPIELAKVFDVHRTTILRALADLEDADLIISRNTDHGETYDLPECARVRAVAGEADRHRKRKDAERAFAKEKQQIENVLMRRLNKSELSRLREKHGLLS